MDSGKTYRGLDTGLLHRMGLLLFVTVLLFVPFGEALAKEGGKELKWGDMTMTLFGGLALFLYGMEMMADALKAVAGDKMKMILAKLTTNRVTGALTGAFVTAVIQSSSVTTVLVVGFISAGLMSFSQALGVIFGANIGTTITAQIVAFKVTKLATLMIAVGFVFGWMGRSENQKHYGWMLMGLGLVFFGMNVMSEAMKPLRSYQPFLDLMTQMESPVIGILISAGFTGLIQSSSATTGIVIVMASQGFITLEAGIALAFGANIGTCVTALLASIGKPREAVRAALAHILFNIVGVILWMGFIPQMSEWMRAISPAAAHLEGMARLAEETPRQIANAHTFFNVSNTLIFLPLVGQFARLIEWMFPDKVGEEAAAEAESLITKPMHLEDVLLSTPALALDAVRREIRGLGNRVHIQLTDVMPNVLEGDLKSLKEVEKRDAEIDSLHAQMVTYLGRISQQSLTELQTRELMSLIAVVDSLENIGDVVETNLVYLGEQRLAKGVKVSEMTATSISDFHKLVTETLERSIQAVVEGDISAIHWVRKQEELVDEKMNQCSAHHIQRLTADEPGRVEAYTVEMDIMEKLRRIFSFNISIVKHTENYLRASQQSAYQA